MSDHCLAVLQQALHHHQGNKLWLADENHDSILPALSPFKGDIQIISNRFDVAQKAQNLGLSAHFNDWIFNVDKPINTVFFRVCKEKPVSQHLIREAYKLLSQDGVLILVGQKNEGIKSYEQFASTLFTGNPKGKHLKKLTNSYMAIFKKRQYNPPEEGQYHQLLEIGQYKQANLYSKHGVYGWNKIDKGSEVLIDHLDQVIAEHPTPLKSILDLGCGYGFLSIASAHIPCERRTATDNNAGALISCKHNAKINNVTLEVIAGDCGSTVEGRFDLILCNPPFHKGFDVDGELTNRFLQASRNKLNNKGMALFVVNSFIPIEKKLTQFFRASKQVVNTGQFKVLALYP